MLETNPPTVSASEAKLRFGEILSQCLYGGKPIYINRHHKTVAVLVNLDLWQKETVSQTDSPQKDSPLYQDLIRLRSKMAASGRKKSKHLPTSSDILRQLREERTSHLAGKK